MASGAATWYVHYDVAIGRSRRRRKHKIGRYDEVSLADAIAQAEQLRPAIRKGADPVADRDIARTAVTFAELAEARFRNGDPLRESTEHDYRHVLQKDILPLLGALPANSINREHIIGLMDRMVERGATRRADTARTVISSVYSYGIDRGSVQLNPARGLRNRHAYHPRDVVLSSGHLSQLWRAMDEGDAIMSPPMVAIIKIALLTGQRRSEIASTRKDDLDLNPARPALLISRARAKNANQHRVPLSGRALQLVLAAREASGDSPYLFPGPTGGPIRPRSVSKAMERTREKLGIPEVTVHDLRRTVGSMMTRYGVPKDVRERVLNHGGKRRGSITESTYSWYDYGDEKRAALELWADALGCITEGRAGEIDDYATRLGRLKGTKLVLVG